MKNLRKTKTLNIITFLSLAIIFITSMIFPSGLLKTVKASALSDNLQVTYDTAFLYEPISSSSLGDYTYVLDQKTNTVVTISNGQILQGEGATFSSYDAKNVFALSTSIILVNQTATELDEMFVALHADTKELKQITIDNNSDILMNGYTYISSYTANNTLYLIMYNLSSDDKLTSFVFLSLTEDEDKILVNDIREISIGSDFAETFKGINSINMIYDETASSITCFTHISTSLIGFTIDESTTQINTINSTIGDRLDLNSSTKIFTVNYNDKYYIMLEKGTTLYVYNLTLESGDNNYTLSDIPSEISLTESNIESLNLSNGILSITFKDAQKVLISRVSELSGQLTLSQVVYSTNPSVEIVYHNSSDFEFCEIASGKTANLLSSPFSKESIASLEAGTCVTKIGYGNAGYSLPLTDRIYGYEYFMFTSNLGVNYYGFLPENDVVSLNVSDSTLPYVYAKKNVNIYKYPSKSDDTINTIIGTTSDITKLEVLRDISEYSYKVTGSTRTFYEVRFESNIGYVEASDIDTVPETTRVQTNAVVLRDSYIYKNADGTEQLYSVFKDKRVRIIDTSSTREKYTLITYNDEDGIKCTGYILTENIQADAWSTLQIIGFVLVLFSIILLIVILIVRNKVNNE